MDVDDTQKLDDLNNIDQIKNNNKNGHDDIDQVNKQQQQQQQKKRRLIYKLIFLLLQDKKMYLKFVKSSSDDQQQNQQQQYQDKYTLKHGLNIIGRADTCDILIPSPVCVNKIFRKHLFNSPYNII
jgi:hypothetical protein